MEPTLNCINHCFLMLQWLVLRYAVQNLEVIHAAIMIAKQEGVSVSLDLASFEVMLCSRIIFFEE